MIKKREDFAQLFFENRPDIGIELGVAQGKFSYQINKAYAWKKFYSVDRWGGDRGHDGREYISTVNLLSQFPECSVIRASFDEALSFFPDDYFDFIYIDGYAHTGQDGGKTLRDWFPKLKEKGIFAGHDYHKDWPLTIQAVDEFCKELNVIPNLTKKDQYPSWYFIK